MMVGSIMPLTNVEIWSKWLIFIFAKSYVLRLALRDERLSRPGEKQKYYTGEIPRDDALNEGDLLVALRSRQPAPWQSNSCSRVRQVPGQPAARPCHKESRPRILFLADRNILANQAYNAFSSFPEDALARIEPEDPQERPGAEERQPGYKFSL